MSIIKSFPMSAVASISSGNSISASTKLAKYTNLSAGKPYIGTKDVGFDGIVNYDSGVLIPDEESSSFRLASPGSVLVCAEGGSAGRKIGLVNKSVCYGNKLFAIKPNNKLDSTYLFYFCRSASFRAQFQKLLSGIIGGVSKKKFETIFIPIPPVLQQKKIAEELQEFESNFVKLMHCQDERFISIEQLLQCALEEEIGRYISGEVCPTKLPVGWKVGRLQDFASKITDGTHHTPKYVSSGVPFITVKNLTAGPGISFENTKFVTEDAHRDYCKRANPEKGDILISKDGTIGVVRMIDTNIKFSIFVSVAIVKPIDKIMSKYLYYALLAPSVQKTMTPKGTALKHLYLEDLREIRIPIPTKADQEEICLRLSGYERGAEKLRSLADRRAALLNELWESKLTTAFSMPGEILSDLAT